MAENSKQTGIMEIVRKRLEKYLGIGGKQKKPTHKQWKDLPPGQRGGGAEYE